MNDVLEKLQRVKIQIRPGCPKKTSNFVRYSKNLYDSTRNHFLSMFVDMETLHQQELTFYGKVQKYADRVYQQNLICMDKKKQTELMEKVHNHFIRTIIPSLTGNMVLPYRNIRMNAIFPCRLWQNPYYISGFLL